MCSQFATAPSAAKARKMHAKRGSSNSRKKDAGTTAGEAAGSKTIGRCAAAGVAPSEADDDLRGEFHEPLQSAGIVDRQVERGFQTQQLRSERERSQRAAHHEHLVVELSPEDTQRLEHLGHASGLPWIGNGEFIATALGHRVAFDHRISILTVPQDRTRRLGLDVGIHHGKDGIVAVALPGRELARSQRLAIANIVLQIHAGQVRGVAEDLRHDRNSVRILKGDGRHDPFQAVHEATPASPSR